MKWLIASDIHGSAYYCRRLLEAYDCERADALLLLGDILYHGPRNDLPREYAPREVAALLNARKGDILCVRGNCDAEVDQMVLDFPITAEYAAISEYGRTFYAVHGHKLDAQGALCPAAGSIVLFGHTHIPEKTFKNGVWYCNPGSVAIPKGNSECGFMTLEWERLLWKTFGGAVIDSLNFAKAGEA